MTQAFVQESAMANAYDALVDKAYKLSVRETIARAGFFGSVGLAGNLGIVAVLGYEVPFATSWPRYRVFMQIHWSTS